MHGVACMGKGEELEKGEDLKDCRYLVMSGAVN